MTLRFIGIKASIYKAKNIYVKNNKRKLLSCYLLNIRISHEVQKYLKIKAGERIAVMHDFEDEYILYIKNIKNIAHQSGFVIKPIDLSYTQHQKRRIKPCLYFAENWPRLKKIPKKLKKGSHVKYYLLKNNTVMIKLKE